MVRTVVAGALMLAGLAAAAPPPALDMKVVAIQVALDRANFSPGVIDGKRGASLTLALKGFQTAHDLPASGEADAATLDALKAFSPSQPVRQLALAPADLAGPFTNPLPKDPSQQATLPALGYRNAVEALAEKFHTTAATLVALNSPDTVMRAGTAINLPNVLPTSRAYDAKLPPNWRATLSSLNVDANAPKAARVLVDKSDGVLRAYDADDKLIAQFPATMGSTHDPLPIGHWKIQGASYNPTFHYNPALFWDAKATDKKATLPPGPNGPVGVIWLDLDKPHYGIHGTPSPETIGRSESHGCIRLSNWDAARLSLMVKPGTPAVFQQ